LHAVIALSPHSLDAIHTDRSLMIQEELQRSAAQYATDTTHPSLYRMVQGLAHKAHIAMPKQIIIYNAEYIRTLRNGVVVKGVREITAYVDLVGDLHICRELLTTLMYEDIEGIIALAMSAKVRNKPGKLTLVALGTLGATIGGLWYASNKYDLSLGELFFGRGHTTCCHESEDRAQALICLLAAPSVMMVSLASSCLQKGIDLDAAKLTNAQQVAYGIEGLDKLKELYEQEGALSRLLLTPKIKRLFRFLSYPIRSYTTEERVDYLARIA